jgi:hypothetical protein
MKINVYKPQILSATNDSTLCLNSSFLRAVSAAGNAILIIRGFENVK